jgi:alpha-D-ribose 1-methylphosphonate 5-triphosphate synthase subunit PhnI
MSQGNPHVRRLNLTLPVATVERLRKLQRADEGFTEMIQRLLDEAAS